MFSSRAIRRNRRKPSESAAYQATPRSESTPSMQPISRARKYVPGGSGGTSILLRRERGTLGFGKLVKLLPIQQLIQAGVERMTGSGG